MKMLSGKTCGIVTVTLLLLHRRWRGNPCYNSSV